MAERGKECFNQFSALFQQRFYFLPQNHLDQNELSINYNISCSFHYQIPEVYWQPWMSLWLYIHFWAKLTLEYVCSSDFSCSTMSLPPLQYLVSHPAQAGQVPLFCFQGAWYLCVQTFLLVLCDHHWIWATKTQLTWKTVNLICKYEMWLMRIDNPARKKKVPVCLVTILGISSFLHLQLVAGSLASGIHKCRETQCIYCRVQLGEARLTGI